MSKFDDLKKQLRRGKVYRRAELARWSNAVDRHVALLVEEGALTKLSGGLYYYPKKTSFGEVPAEDEKLVKAFLKDDRFLLTSPNAYNSLGVGSTQLYNETVVYNHKRHGRFKLGNRFFDFRMKPHFPKTVSHEFLLVDLVNNLNRISEQRSLMLEGVARQAKHANQKVLANAVSEYGGVRAKNFFAPLLARDTVAHDERIPS